MKGLGFRVVSQLYRCLQYKQAHSLRGLSSLTQSKRKIPRKRNSKNTDPEEWKSPLVINNPEFDWNFLCDKNNLDHIKENIEKRKGVGDIEALQAVWTALQNETSMSKKEELKRKAYELAADIPNTSSQLTPIGDETQAKLIDTYGEKKEFSFVPKSVIELGKNLGILRTENLSLTTGTTTYYLLGDLAQLEQALIQYTLKHLISAGFSVLSVPDIIHPSVIEGCGFKTTGEKTQVYKLDDQDLCLAGTAEMSLGGHFINKVLHHEELPKKICAVSRCYRAEVSALEEGIYRVHQFTKVEMFGVTKGSPEESSKLMNEFFDIQVQLFSGLGIHFRVLEMPTQELGAPAHRKIDIEAWMPNKEFWGEISSTSDCTDFQSRRLCIKYKDSDDQLLHAHTVNGTACAVPRLIMNLVETNQTEDGDVIIPTALKPWMNGKDKLTKIESQMRYYHANRLEKMKS